MAQPSSRMSLSFKVGDQPVPGYRLVRELGRGTFGVVWLAVTENGFERALKVVNLEQKGGKKEFRALRLIKDRKILHGNLLTLIDYWLLDRDGTIISTPGNVNLDTQLSPAKVAGTAANLAATTDPATAVKVQQLKLNPGIQGTMMPGAEGDTAFNVRDTFQQSRLADTAEEENSQAIWLVVAMELGHKTLHDRQKEHTTELQQKTPTRVSRRGVTQLDAKGDTSPGSNTTYDKRAADQQAADDDELSPLPADEVLPYMEQAARGLDYLHRCEIVHRDVKPQNIMLVGDVAKVCDYGLASELGDLRATTNAFTLPYAAPDAINNRPCPASDQYSLAVTYVELRTGRWPFVSNTATAVYGAKETGVHHLKFVPKRAVRAVLKKALSKNPNDRYATCGEFVKQLAKAEHSRSGVFAALQVALAMVAIITVLLAASATHPGIRQAIVAYIDSFRKTDVKEFERRVRVAERQLMEERNEDALGEFRSLYRELPRLPKDRAELRYDAILGLARAEISEASKVPSSEIESRLKYRIEEMLADPEAQLNPIQGLRLYYLQVIAKQKPIEIGGVNPGSEESSRALAAWELALWTNAIQEPVDDPRLPPNLKDSLRSLVAQRKAVVTPEDFARAKESLDQMLATAKESLGENDGFWQLLKLEELHLAFKHPEANHDQNLRSLDTLLADRLQQDRQAFIRGQLLRLLILNELRNAESSFFDDAVHKTVAATDGGLLKLQETAEAHFAIHEITALNDLRARYKNEIRDWPEAIPDEAFPALLGLCGKLEAFDLLRARVRKHLDETQGPPSLAAIQASWSDLTKFIATDTKLKTAEAADLADLDLCVSFADAAAKPEAALDRFVERVRESRNGAEWMKRLLDRTKQNTAWVDVALAPLKELSVNPTPDLQGDENFDRWRSETNNLTLTGILTQELSSPAAAKKVIARLDQAPDQKQPLPALVRVECEVVLNPQPDEAQRDAWRTRIRSAASEIDPTDTQLKSYGDYLNSRWLAASSNSYDQSEAGKKLLDILKKDAAPSWLVSGRREVVAKILSRLVLASLGKNDEDIVRFHQLSNIPEPARVTEARSVIAGAKLESPALAAVSAVIEASRGKAADWTKVKDLSQVSLNDSDTRAALEAHEQLLLVRFVSARAQLELSPAQKPLDETLIRDFHSILFADDGDEKRIFSFPGPRTSDDGGIFRNLVLPILSHPSLQQPLQPKQTGLVQLGALWGAKGRLLQRNTGVVAHDPAYNSAEKDLTTAALTLAHRAFQKARECQPKFEDYAVGYGRTLIDLPTSEVDPEQRAKEITQIVEDFDPQGKSKNLGMLYMGAYVRRYQSHEKHTPKERLPLSDEAIRRYELVIEGTENSDPFDLRSMSLEGLSDSHLRRAFWIPKTTVTKGEVEAFQSGGELPAGTKAFHLRAALDAANAAINLAGRIQQENAYNALGNASEDVAFYLGLSDYYERSIEAFRTGIDRAKDEERPVARAKMHLGRCMFRYGRDLLANLSDKKRIEVLEAARVILSESLAESPEQNRLRAETYFWRADAGSVLSLYKPADAPTLLRDAENDLVEASEIGLKSGSPQAHFYRVQQIEVALAQHEHKGVSIVLKSAALDRAQIATEKLFTSFEAAPNSFDSETLRRLAILSPKAFPSDPDKYRRWLFSGNQVRARWRTDDNWLNEAVTLLLRSAMTFNRPEDAKQAESLIGQIEETQIKAVANAGLHNLFARQEFDVIAKFDRQVATIPTAEKNSKIKAKLLESLPVFEKCLAANEATLQPKTQERLERVKRAKLQRILAGDHAAEGLEARLIGEHIALTQVVREKIYSMAYNLAVLSPEKEQKLKWLKVAQDAVKPIYLADDAMLTGDSKTSIMASKAKYTSILQTRERDLADLDYMFE
ncbi:serine/threonine-protein kinase [Anatilimnocola sp. NA78]|uniref:serine/threonine-protein kinase n=1 Tax=Anatilimnocola sp. NA78 TaxID=3415683 RepID=UPI003CE5AFAE